MFRAIPGTGISARALSREIGINLRRTYKYLRRLRSKGLVFALKVPRTYELTQKETETASFLEEVTGLAVMSLKAPLLRLKQSS
jgi:sugar-specific transcriptional regulator TrmB